jgi:hypothetical protein
MAKITNPLFSQDARGSVAKLINYQNQIGTNIARLHLATNLVPTTAQKLQREAYASQSEKWLTLPINERQRYVKRAEKLQISGFNLFLKEALIKSTTKPSTEWDNGASSWDNGASQWLI